MQFRSVFTILLLGALSTTQAQAREPFIGEIMWIGSNFCPRGWTGAEGQLLSIAQNTALFSLYGTMYGGDGRTTFGLPDLRGRVAVHAGQGPGLANYTQGSRGGLEHVTLSANQMPTHRHSINASSTATDKNAAGSIIGSPKQKTFDPASSADVTLAANAVSTSGGNQAHENRSPYITLRACVALEGLFPSRN
jgi:microcystin-dependent protein